jgi:nucleoside-diphosphate kinase
VRGKFGRITTKGVFENVVHVSSDEGEARREIALWFDKKELLKI